MRPDTQRLEQRGKAPLRSAVVRPPARSLAVDGRPRLPTCAVPTAAPIRQCTLPQSRRQHALSSAQRRLRRRIAVAGAVAVRPLGPPSPTACRRGRLLRARGRPCAPRPAPLAESSLQPLSKPQCYTELLHSPAPPPKTAEAETGAIQLRPLFFGGRGGGIRTHDLLLPKQAL